MDLDTHPQVIQVMEGWGKSGKDMEDNGSSYPNTRCLNNVKIVMGGGGWPVEL